MKTSHGNRLRIIAKLKLRFHTGILASLVVTLCYLAAKLGGVLIINVPQTLWPLWPGCAVLVAILLLLPRKIWPILIPAGLAGFVLYDLQVGVSVRSIAWFILGNTFEILVAACGVSYSLNGLPRLNSPKALAKYSFFTVILASLVGSSIGIHGLNGDRWISWRITFLSEGLAFLTLTPAILGCAGQRRTWLRASHAYYLEATALLTALISLSLVLFVAPGRSYPPALLYSLVPFLLWSALRFGSMGVGTSATIVALLSIWGVLHGQGPFTETDPINNVLSLQLFLLFTAAPFMVLAALVEEHEQDEQVLRESEKRFRFVADTAPALIWMSGTDKLRTYFNKSWLDFTGRSIDSQLGNGWAEGVHPGDLERCLDTYTQAFDRRAEFRMEYQLRRHDGEYRWILDIGVPRFNQYRTFVGYIGIGVDVSERKRAEEAQRESEERLRLAVKTGRMYAFEWDTVTDVIVRSAQFAEFLNWIDDPTPDTGRQFIARVHPDDREAYAATETGPTPDNPTYQASYRMLRPDGGVVWLEESGHAFFGGQGRMLRIIGMVVDVTERKLAEQALSNVSRRLIETQEQERARIARELHDDLSQRMVLLQIGLDQLSQNTPRLTSNVRQQLNKISELASEISSDIHNMSYELHPAKLDLQGLVAAMGGFCREFSKQHDLQIKFVHYDVPGQIPKDVALCLFRIVQEAVRNVVKHAKTAEAKVELSGHGDGIDLCISDTGAGFSPESAQAKGGLGLISMRERLRLVGGHLAVASEPLHGTQIRVRVPLAGGTDQGASAPKPYKANA